MKRNSILIRAVCVCLILCTVLACASAAGLENFSEDLKKVPSYRDVKKKDWFYPYVRSVAGMGLMVGNSANTFNPGGEVTLAETVTIAARLHSIYYTGTENFKQGKVWYQVYLDYAEDAGITVPAVSGYNRKATRAEFAQVIASAFPAEALEPINELSDTAVPDVALSMSFGEAVYTLYRAGILMGNDEAGTFSPYSTVKRSEVAAIVSRVAIAEDRIRLELPETQKPAPGQTDKPEAPETPAPTAPAFVVDTVEAAPGQQQVAVSVSVQNNPGISALALVLSYDSALELDSIVYNPGLSGETMPPQAMKNPIRLLWLNPFEDVTEDFVLATAYFNVPQTADPGSYQIAVTYDPNDVYELSETNVHFDVVQGAIVIK